MQVEPQSAGAAEAPFFALEQVTEGMAPLLGARLVAALIMGEGVEGRHLAVSDAAMRSEAEGFFTEQMDRPDGWLEMLRQQGFRMTMNELRLAMGPEELAGLLGPEEFARLLVVPLLVRGAAVGGLLVVRDDQAPPFLDSDVRLAENVANVLALSIGVSVHTHELDSFFAASLELLCMIDPAGHLHRLNPQWDRILGYDPLELEGALFLDFVHPEDRAATSAAFADLREAKVPAQFVNRFRADNGTYRSMEWFARPGADLIFAAARDITERLGQEQALRESETRLHDLLLTTGDWIWEIDTDGRYTSVSGKVEEVIGYRPEEVIGHTVFDFMMHEEKRRMGPMFTWMTERREGCSGLITHCEHKEGHEVILLRACVPTFNAAGEFAGFRGLDKDVTLRERLGRALQESEDRYRLIAENTNDVIVVVDIDSMNLEYVSPSMERLTGFTAEELIDGPMDRLLAPEALERVYASADLHRKAFDAGDQEAGYYLVETEFLDKDGGTVPVELSVKVLIDGEGRSKKHVTLCRDISARKQAEQALRDSRKRIEDLMFIVGDWMWEADAQYRYTQCSDGVRAVLGYEPEEVIGRTPWSFMLPEEAKEHRRRDMEKAERREGSTEVVNRNLHRDGREVILLTSCVPIVDDAGELVGFRGIDKDITTTTQTQDSLRRSVVELNALWQIAEAVAAPGDLTAALNSVTRQVSDALEARFALVVTFADSYEGVHVVASTAADTAWCGQILLGGAPEHLPRLARLAASGEPMAINDLGAESLPDRMAEQAAERGFSRLLLVPLVLQREIIGMLVVTRPPDAPAFRERDIEFAQAAAGSLAAAAVHARLREEENLRTANQVRDHLARELHDAVTQSVYSASLIAQALPTIWSRSPEDGMAGLGQLQRLVRSALAELRILLYELRPGTLAGVGLDQLIDRLGDSLAGQADVDVQIDSHVDEPPPPEVKEALYRIAQEAFNNIAKHARAANVAVSVASDEQGARLEVQDDGIGVDAEAVEGDHHGLAIMRERAEEIGAELKIGRIEPTGTRLTVCWAMPERMSSERRD